MDVDVILATVVTVLASLAVIGVLALCIVWEALTLHRMIANYKQPSPQEATDDFWRGRAVTIPPADHAPIRQDARVMEGESVRQTRRKWQ